MIGWLFAAMLYALGGVVSYVGITEDDTKRLGMNGLGFIVLWPVYAAVVLVTLFTGKNDDLF